MGAIDADSTSLEDLLNCNGVKSGWVEQRSKSLVAALTSGSSRTKPLLARHCRIYIYNLLFG